MPGPTAAVAAQAAAAEPDAAMRRMSIPDATCVDVEAGAPAATVPMTSTIQCRKDSHRHDADCRLLRAGHDRQRARAAPPALRLDRARNLDRQPDRQRARSPRPSRAPGN